jgi:hypothetical protein
VGYGATIASMGQLRLLYQSQGKYDKPEFLEMHSALIEGTRYEIGFPQASYNVVVVLKKLAIVASLVCTY